MGITKDTPKYPVGAMTDWFITAVARESIWPHLSPWLAWEPRLTRVTERRGRAAGCRRPGPQGASPLLWRDQELAICHHSIEDARLGEVIVFGSVLARSPQECRWWGVARVARPLPCVLLRQPGCGFQPGRASATLLV